MATVTHYIRSHYDPIRDRDRLQLETGQTIGEPEPHGEEEDPWQTEFTFGVRHSLASAPRFVRATLPYDEWGNIIINSPEPVQNIEQDEKPQDLASWYRTLTQRTDQKDTPPAKIPKSSSVCLPSTSTSHSLTSTARTGKRKDRDWFISRALAQSASSSTPAPSSTLADILSRDPPADQPLKPPIFLHLGPSNRGWAMLQRHGWNEGEGLGRSVARRGDVRLESLEGGQGSGSKRPEVQVHNIKVKQEEITVDEGMVKVKDTQVIDLTLSESESEDGEDIEIISSSSLPPQQPDVMVRDHSSQNALLTPIATVLKSDRLGIGLKAKTEGPYRASIKRVTHNAAALQAHVQAGEELRRTKTLVGKGGRGFERLQRKERERRQEMLAYLNHN
ncbi:hypothetical protein HETIRDRAFT_125147 [Heterobasidion irregulare TC 32-1]|uniref:G-patch domain-containing protein n=1 Tax=Heterobasidion irregulare (strain TC 32-1) TaxID=747525 RepID=W4K7E5_HETIT|nr:uncharacterized protein HETIRDRAFT_125147 [Heterobasidion irregulare TC 32-1]ETW81684.1 hypothetical protein HETIRDRAFT_125147 [Heterobasidion irregulare TC 32-1]